MAAVSCGVFRLAFVYVATDSEQKGTKPSAARVLDNQAVLLWTLVLDPTPQKWEAVLVRRIGSTINQLKEAGRLKRKVNLRFNAQTLRCHLSHDDAYEVGAPAITELAAGMSVGLPSAFVLTLAMLLTAGDAFAFG